MPNQKLLEEKINKLHNAVMDTFYDYSKEKNSDGRDWRELQDKFKASFRTLMAAIALANDPAYNIPENADLDAEIEKRRKKLEADETFVQATYGSEDDIVSVPKEKWESEDKPETLPLEDIIKNFDAKMKAKQAEEKQHAEQHVEQDAKQNIVQNADKWIEEFRKGGLKKMEDGKEVIDTDQFANIMAARMLVNSVRGKQKSLQNPISMEDIAQKADELKDDPTYQNFLWKLESDPKAMQQALSAAKSGHGGGLDDMFKKHVKELPPGELSNSPVLARYMPTAKERIEFLQAHAEQHPGNPTETIAEIIALRNLVHAERGKASSLNTPIPTDPERSLQAKEKPLHQSIPRLGMRLMNSGTDIIKLIARGHGGEMLEAFRAGAQKLRAEAQMLRLDPETLDGFHENTIGSRLKQLRGEAKNLGKNPSAEQVQTLLGEYLILDRMTRDPKTGQIDEDKLNMDTPWSKVAKNTERYVKDPEFKRIMGTMKDDQLLTVAEGMATKPQESFVNSVWGKMVDIHKTLESATAKKAQQAPQPSVEVEKLRKPEAPEMGKK